MDDGELNSSLLWSEEKQEMRPMVMYRAPELTASKTAANLLSCSPPECAYAIPNLSYNGGQQHGGFDVLKKMRKTEGNRPGEDEKPAHCV